MWQRRSCWLGVLFLVLAACGPAAQEATVATAPPRATNTPVASVPAASATVTPVPKASATPAPAAAASSAATDQPKYGGTFIASLRGDPTGWDGWMTKSGANDVRKQHNIAFSMLASVPAVKESQCSLDILPDAAESWKWTNATTFELKLRSGIKFHNKPPVNGREMTAEDVVNSFQQAWWEVKMRDYELMAPYIKSMQAIDRYTVRFTTDAPLSPLVPRGLGNPYGAVIVPKEVMQPKTGWNDPVKSYIGSGPFMFKQWIAGVKVVYERNPDYFKKGQPYVDQFVFLIVPDMATRLAAVRSGKLDLWSDQVPVTVAMEVRRTNPDFQIQKCPSNAYHTHVVMAVQKPPFNDVKVRRAISMAIDRQALLQSVLQGEGTFTPLFPPLSSQYLTKMDEVPADIRQYVEYHPDKSKQLLAEAGYPNGFEASINATSYYGSPHVEFAQAIASMLEKVGVKAKINWQQYTTYQEVTIAGKFDSMGLTMVGIKDPFQIFGRFYGPAPGTSNYQRVADPQFDALMDQYNQTVDEAKATELARQMQFRLIDQAWAILTPAAYDYSIAQPWVRGFYYSLPLVTSRWAENVWLSR